MTTKTSRRDAQRIPIRIRIESVDKFAEQHGEALRDGWIFLPTDQPHSVGTELDIEFRVGELGSSIRARGVVIRSVRPTGMTQGPAGMRIQMTLLDEMAKMFVDQVAQQLPGGGTPPAREASADLESPSESDPGETNRPNADWNSIEAPNLVRKDTFRSNLLFTLPEELLKEILGNSSQYSREIRQRAEKLLALREAEKTARS